MFLAEVLKRNSFFFHAEEIFFFFLNLDVLHSHSPKPSPVGTDCRFILYFSEAIFMTLMSRKGRLVLFYYSDLGSFSNLFSVWKNPASLTVYKLSKDRIVFSSTRAVTFSEILFWYVK